MDGGVDGGFVAAGPADLMAGRVACRTIEGRRVLIARSEDGDWHAVQADCSHMEMPLDRARVRGGALLCPHHGARFDLATGAVLSPPASEPLTRWETRVRDGIVEVKL